MYAVNPAQRLRLLLRRLSGAAGRLVSERDFYDEMLGTFCELRDLHTTFVLPEPFRSTTAWLPFSIEACQVGGRRQYVVSHVMAGVPEGFAPGAVVTHWNGIPIERAVAINAAREQGTNPAARRAQGIAAMTVRWLGQQLPPDEQWVTVRFRPPRRRARSEEATFEWFALQQTTSPGDGAARALGDARMCVGMDERAEVERQVRRALFARATPGPVAGPAGRAAVVSSRMPDVFPTCGNVVTKWGTFAYVRLATFNVAKDDPFLEEFVRIVSRLSQQGLILDVRGNGGGLITAGERLLQLLTPRPIEPARFHFLNTSRTAQLAARNDFLRRWRPSIEQAVETGADYSLGFPLLPAAAYNDIGQKYQGPVVLITDALCYSTTDIFAAGFQDHRIGTILGVDEATGAGGANVWAYPLIAALARDRVHLPARLPRDASFRFAVRRVTRVGESAGLPLEDLGVRPDEVRQLTLRDVLERNVDLISRAAALLARRPTQALRVRRLRVRTCRVSCENLDRVDAYVDGHPLSTRETAPRRSRFTIMLPRAGTELRLEGFRHGQLVASTQLSLRQPLFRRKGGAWRRRRRATGSGRTRSAPRRRTRRRSSPS
jgi:hypothetical protein